MSDAIGRMLGKRKAVSVPQSQPMEDDQVQNNAGGFVWEVSPLTRLRRFLVLGSDGGSYYTTETELTVDNAKALISMIESGQGKQLVEEIRAISLAGRAAKQNPTLFALALAARYPCETLGATERRSVAAAAYQALGEVCRIPTHLFTFVDYSEKVGPSSGWGRAHRAAVSRWYTDKEPKNLAFAVTKYPQRGGWSHRDLLRLSHARPKCKENPEKEADLDAAFAYVTHGADGLGEKMKKQEREQESGSIAEFFNAVEELKATKDPHYGSTLIRQHHLAREHIPTELLNRLEIWEALFPQMPMTASIRNLPKMTTVGLLTEQSDATKTLCERLRNEEALHKARVHPYSVLLAHETYKAGRGDKGKLTWEPVRKIVSALDDAFYLAFKNVPSSGKRFLVALDVSGSMDGCCISNSNISARLASAAMSLIHLRTEEAGVDFVAFTETLTPLKFTSMKKKTMKLEEMVSQVQRLSFGATDCAQPMEWARKRGKDYDVFVVYTDCETWAGKVHPAEALRRYRRERVRDARLVVVGMTASNFTIADPLDPGMLDIAGFDAAAPQVLRNFVLGHI